MDLEKKKKYMTFTLKNIALALIVYLWKGPRIALAVLFSFNLFNYLKGTIVYARDFELVGPSFGRMFFSVAENICDYIPQEKFYQEIAKFCDKEKLSTNLELWYDKILILFPDLVELRSQLNSSQNNVRQDKISSLGLIYSLTRIDNDSRHSNHYFTSLNDVMSLPYKLGTGERFLELSTIRLVRRNNPKKEAYFACLDNRPLVNLVDCEMSDEELYYEQEAYFQVINCISIIHTPMPWHFSKICTNYYIFSVQLKDPQFYISRLKLFFKFRV